MLEIKGLVKKYKNKVAVNDITITVNDGDIFGFIGHNGAGKTTTIKCVVGICDYDNGEIYINGVSVKENPIECKQNIAYIPDNPDLYESLTGIQYINFICDIYGVSKGDRQNSILYFSDKLELTQNLGDLISSYSHGMKQKLAIISALVHKPKLLVLDEPFVGLDPKAAHTLKEIMKDMCLAGSSVFFSTHVLETAEKLCNKVAIIKSGEIVANGTMEEVRGNNSLENVFLELIEK